MRHASARAFASALGQPSTLVMPAAMPDAGSAPVAPSLFEGSSDEATVLVPAAKPTKPTKPAKPAKPATAVVAPKPPAAEPVTAASGRTRRTMALAGGLLLVVVIATFMSGALDAGDGREADEQAVQDESTTTNSPTTTSTIAVSTTLPEVTPASLAAEIGEILATLEPPEYKPKDVREIEDRVNKAVDQWSEGEREMAAKSLEDAFASLDKLPESEAHDELFVLLTTLTEEMGFTVENEDDD